MCCTAPNLPVETGSLSESSLSPRHPLYRSAMEFSPAVITFAGVASGFENTLAAIWKCVLLQSNLIAIPLPKPYNRDVESQPSMAWANKIELNTSGHKASLRAAIFQHLGDLRDMCRDSGRKYTFVMSEGTWWHSSIRRFVSSPTKMVALVEVLATAITVCVIRKSASPTALWMWLPAFSRFLLNMITNISLLSLFLRKCFFFPLKTMAGVIFIDGPIWPPALRRWTASFVLGPAEYPSNTTEGWP